NEIKIDEKIQRLEKHPRDDGQRHLQDIFDNGTGRQVFHGDNLPRTLLERMCKCYAAAMVNPGPQATKFSDSETLSLALSSQLAANLKAAVAARGLASLVVSGGKSPTRLFQLLSAADIDWSRVCVALADERWVDPSDAGSNEKLVRDVLLQ